jgi:phosphopantetheinyl transferase
VTVPPIRPRTALPGAGEVHVWLLRLDLVPEIAHAWNELSPREAQRAARFRADDDRHRYIAQSAGLRRVLRRYGVDPGTSELQSGVNGKPALSHPTDIRFNASRSGRNVLIGVTCGTEIGVDVEQIRPMADLDAFSHGAMDREERAELAAMDPDQRLIAALHTWTAKEAVLKGTGDGLSIDPGRFGFERRPAGTPWRPRAEPGLERLLAWSVIHLLRDDVIAAIAVPQERWRMRVDVPTSERL